MSSPNPAQIFLLEAEDLLTQIEEIAVEAQQEPGNPEAINRLFRAFHTIKGSGAMFGFDAVARFTHHVETALDQVRGGTVRASVRLMELILTARDHLATLLQADEPAIHDALSASIIAAFNELVAAGTTGPGANPAPADGAGTMAMWHIRFRPPANVAASGLDPLALLNELRGLGPCVVAADVAAIPALAHLQAEECHVGWDIALTTDRGSNAIKDVFIFIEDGSELTIAREAPAAPEPAGAATVGPASPPAVAPEPPAKADVLRKAPGREASVRVPSERLDRLVNLVGELVMNQSRLTQAAARLDDADLTVPVEELERLIAEVRDTVLGIRMMPIGTTFTHFKRLVHDLSGNLLKEIDLVTEGAETELDKTVLDQLGDPLVHLIRNSIDHGIELPDERVRLGKPRRGTVRLKAAHTGSNVVITIEDDGRGLDTAAIRAKAVEQNLIPPDAVLSQREIFNLILLPGFSTAKAVTSVSGRGVGMDVVKRQIDLLGGTLQITSEAGGGTAIAATLPLTLAIIEGLLVEIDRDQFIIPMGAVQENVELARTDRTRHNGRNAVAIRGELVPYVFLRETFAVPGTEPDLEKIVIVRHGADRVGLVVDRVLGSHQTVIQSLGRFYRGIEVLSGATIMGDGRVALILDLPGLIRIANARAQAALVQPSRLSVLSS